MARTAAKTGKGRTARRDVGDAAALATSLLDEEERRLAVPEPHVDVGDEELPGVGGEEMPMRSVIGAGGWGMITVLFLLNLVDEFDRIAIAILGPDIQRTFNLNDTALTALSAVGGVVVFAAAIPLGLLADRRRRTFLVGVTSLVWAVFAFVGGFTRNALQLGATRIFNGLGKGNGPVVSSLLADRYPIEGRARVFALHGLANPIGNLIGPLAAGGIAAVAGGVEGWRWSLAILSVPGLVLALLAFRMREPRRGAHERAALKLDVQPTFDAAPGAQPQSDPIPIAAGFERLRKIRTFSAVMSGLGALGFAGSGAGVVFNLLLERQYDLDSFGRGVVVSITSIGGLVGLAIGGRLGDRIFRRNPGGVMRLLGATFAVFGVIYTAGLYMPEAWMLVAFHIVAGALVAAPVAVSSSMVASIVPYRMRGLAFAMVGIYFVLVGGLIGSVVTGVLSDAVGGRTALTIMMPFACFGAGSFAWRASRHVQGDIALVVADIREEEAERSRIAKRGGRDELLQIRSLDFSYGPVQVLFGVDLHVERGETLALLGTNGAGKSTVLRVISGLALPDRGVVRFNGRDVTFTDAPERVRRGIVQVPGGKAIFPDLSVQENLIAGAYTFMWDAKRLERKADDVLTLFPLLVERLDQPARTLSGGEQQMLGLAKALLLEPELLLVDELSLGLAPVAVQEILATVEALKERGITMVIVEQSLNVALSIANRAVFMEKGRVRFEGPADELLDRHDLVRSVFLGGEGG